MIGVESVCAGCDMRRERTRIMLDMETVILLGCLYYKNVAADQDPYLGLWVQNETEGRA